VSGARMQMLSSTDLDFTVELADTTQPEPLGDTFYVQ
jgi:hypothetical protein